MRRSLILTLCTLAAVACTEMTELRTEESVLQEELTKSSALPLASGISVTADGCPVPVISGGGFTLCNIAADSFPVKISVTASEEIHFAEILPTSRGIAAEQTAPQVITFDCAGPEKLTVLFNGSTSGPLHLNLRKNYSTVPSANDPDVHYFHKGTTTDVGILDLKDNQTVYIEDGAVIKGMIRARNARNIRICGHGILDARANKTGNGWSDDRLQWRAIYLDGCENARIEGITIYGSTSWTIMPFKTSNLEIDDIIIANWHPGSDGIDLNACQHVKVSNSFIRANDDCIAIKSIGGQNNYDTENFENCRTPDVTDIDIESSSFWNVSWGNCLEIGFEFRCDKVSDIRFRNCDILMQGERGAVLSIHNGDAATVEKVSYEDIRIENADMLDSSKLADLAILLSLWSRDAYYQGHTRRVDNAAWDNLVEPKPGFSLEPHLAFRGTIRDITFKNIQIVSGQCPYSILSGFSPEHLVENISFENIRTGNRKMDNPENLQLKANAYTKGIRIL